MATQTESAWCETRVENWLRDHYDDVQRLPNQFPDFRVGQDLAVEVTALKTLAVAGTSSAETVERRVQCIIEGSLAGIPFHPSYGRCHLVVEYGLPKPPRKHALLQQVRTALEPYAEPGQLICADPCLRLECGVRLGLLSVHSPTTSGAGLVPRIGIQMNSEGCFPGVEARRAIVDALERKTPKAINWRATRAGSVCWLALVSRIPDMYFVDTFPREVADWKRTIHVPAVWQRVLFWPFPETEGPKAEIITGRTGDGQCRSDSWGRFPSSRVLLQNSSPSM